MANIIERKTRTEVFVVELSPIEVDVLLSITNQVSSPHDAEADEALWNIYNAFEGNSRMSYELQPYVDGSGRHGEDLMQLRKRAVPEETH